MSRVKANEESLFITGSKMLMVSQSYTLNRYEGDEEIYASKIYSMRRERALKEDSNPRI